MRITLQWIALVVIVLVLYVADLKHLATSEYNVFLLLLLGMVTGLVLFTKILHHRSVPTDREENAP